MVYQPACRSRRPTAEPLNRCWPWLIRPSQRKFELDERHLGPDRYPEARRAPRKVRAPSANDCFLDDRRTRLPEVNRELAEDRSSALVPYQYDLARLLSVQHQAYALGGPLHRQGMSNVWDQTCIGNEVQQRVELVQRAVEGSGD